MMCSIKKHQPRLLKPTKIKKKKHFFLKKLSNHRFELRLSKMMDFSQKLESLKETMVINNEILGRKIRCSRQEKTGPHRQNLRLVPLLAIDISNLNFSPVEIVKLKY